MAMDEPQTPAEDRSEALVDAKQLLIEIAAAMQKIDPDHVVVIEIQVVPRSD